MSKIYDFDVQGRGAFPDDMLRYDACYPSDGDSVGLLHITHQDGFMFREQRTIKLRSYHPPTPGRWASFGWYVKNLRIT